MADPIESAEAFADTLIAGHLQAEFLIEARDAALTAAVREPLETQLDEMRLRLHGQADRIASLEAALHSAERLADARFTTVQELEHRLDEAEAQLASAREGRIDMQLERDAWHELARQEKLTSTRGLRPVVLWFAEQMEAKLRENDHKGGWHKDSPLRLMERTWQEAGELEATLAAGPAEAIVREAADVANMAMMVADHFREGGPSEDSGRSGFDLPPPAAQKEPSRAEPARRCVYDGTPLAPGDTVCGACCCVQPAQKEPHGR